MMSNFSICYNDFNKDTFNNGDFLYFILDNIKVVCCTCIVCGKGLLCKHLDKNIENVLMNVLLLNRFENIVTKGEIVH